MHFEKYTFQAGLQIVKHCERNRSASCRYGNMNIDSSKSFLNETIEGMCDSEGEKVPFLPYTEAVKVFKEETEKIKGRSIQEKANMLVSAVVTLPEAYQAPAGVSLKDWYTPERIKEENELWRAIFQFFKEHFAFILKTKEGQKVSNMIYFTVHRDETAAHCHCGFIPVLKETKTKTKRFKDSDGNIQERTVCSRAGTICADEVINRAFLTVVHKNLDKYLLDNVGWYKGGVLLSEEDRQRKGQNLTMRELKSLPDDFRQQRTMYNRLDSLIQAVGDIRGKQADIEALKKEVQELSEPENFPPSVRLVYQLIKDGKLNSSDLVKNEAYFSAVKAYKAYKEALRGVQLKLDTLTKGGRD